jgi:hypothetical protein
MRNHEKLSSILLSVVLICLGYHFAGAADGFYRELAGHWSPVIYQDTSFMPEGDYLTRFDGDGDWVGKNNLDNHLSGRFRPYPSYLYYTVIESWTHYFIIYGFFHPVDYDSRLAQIIPGMTHENDMEGMMMVVAKVPGERMGRFRIFETWSHLWWNFYSSKDRVMPRHIQMKEKADLSGSHPLLYVQQEGHGLYGLHSRKSMYRWFGGFRGDTGVIYYYQGEAEAPEGPNDREVGYDLIAFEQPGGIWEHRCDLATFDKRPFAYEPPEGRPSLAPHPPGCPFKPGQVPICFDGDESGFANQPDGANCFWGWGKVKGGSKGSYGLNWQKQLNGKSKGVWGFDPAWAINWQFEFQEPFSLDYIYNPYLDLKE